jgi:hypothetical protein
MKRDKIEGYEETLCLKCTNSDDSAVYDNWKFTLNPPHPCSYSMSVPATVEDASLTFKKLSESDPQVIWPVSGATSWDDVFSNTALS